MFKLKICGVLLKSDIDAAAKAGADCIGLNFYEESVRYVEPDSLETLSMCRHARKLGLQRAGVFVNRSADEIAEIAQGLDLDLVQLHGDSTLADANELRELGIDVIKAVRLPTGSLSVKQIYDAASPWTSNGFHVLLDAESTEHFGGSGKQLDWKTIAEWAWQNPAAQWTLAGGLKAENVAEAIRTTGAKSVDVASGVEEPRGTKDAKKITQFCETAKAALN